MGGGARRLAMPNLICLGLGYSAQHYLARFGHRHDRIIGTARSRERAAAAGKHVGLPLEGLAFDGRAASNELAAALDDADALLVSIPPTESGDPVLAALSGPIARASRLQTIVYLSTVGVYGDHGGGWVDEDTEPRPLSARSQARRAAELAWQGLAQHGARRVGILRIAGIYGPGRNALVQLQRGSARHIVKPGQIFNRIHVADLTQAIDAMLLGPAEGVFNVADDEPAPPQDVLAFAAELIGCALPPPIPFGQAQASVTAMALSFYAENKRVRNARLKTELGVKLRYPSYREGLRALFEGRDQERNDAADQNSSTAAISRSMSSGRDRR
jgi:nucleoside-diphosphate-sugar epimerase